MTRDVNCEIVELAWVPRYRAYYEVFSHMKEVRTDLCVEGAMNTEHVDLCSSLQLMRNHHVSTLRKRDSLLCPKQGWTLLQVTLKLILG